jgi:ABC-type dipeptide/oligopeptide/nickel transport system permease subunit
LQAFGLDLYSRGAKVGGAQEKGRVSTLESAVTVPVTARGRTPRELFWSRFRQDKAALVGGVVICILVFLAIFGGPLSERITGHEQNEPYLSEMTDEFGLPKGPNSSFYFGADAAGRDLFVRTISGARTSLLVGIVASSLAVFIGVVVGLFAGFFGGFADTLL